MKESTAVAANGSRPVVAVVGRPNVGKSTLVNRIVGRREAIVEEHPGVTRDRKLLDADWAGRDFTIVDTGGWLAAGDSLDRSVSGQAERAIAAASVVMLVVDTTVGVTDDDAKVAALLRRLGRPTLVVANKVDGDSREADIWAFTRLGLGDPYPISALHGRGTGDLLDEVVARLPAEPPVDAATAAEEPVVVPSVAIVGQPNVGKSTLFNRLIGDERSVVHDLPGTTRDSIDTLVEHKGRQTVLIDTAGIRRRGRVGQGVEKYSVLRSNRAIDRCDVAVLMIDGLDGITAQDTHIAGYIDEAAKGIVIVINKWDLVRERLRAEAELADPDHVVSLEPGKNPVPAGTDETLDAEQYIAIVRERLKFVPYAPVVFASAKTHYHVGPILDHAQQIFETRAIRVATPQLNDVVREAVQRHHPPVVLGRPMRIYYVTQANVNPPTFVFFVNDPSLLHFSYERYLENRLRAVFGFDGTAIRMEFRARETTRDDDDGKSHKKRKPAGRRR